MNRSAVLKIVVALSLFASISLQTAWAQGSSTLGGIELTASIANPFPGQEVTISAKSYSFNLNAATLSWTSQGSSLGKGVGVTSIKVKAPALGKTMTVNVSAVTSAGASYTNSIVISSASIDLVLESDGHVPPLFPGKTAVAYQNTVKITAIPHLANSTGTEYDPKTLVYKWEVGGKVLEDQNGYGKQSVIVPGMIVPRPYNAIVTVSTRDGRAGGMGTISVSPANPHLTFYPNDPLYGPLYNRAAGETIYLGSEREIGVIAEPFGFNMPKTGLGDLIFTWFINGYEKPELAKGQSVTLRAPDNSAGESSIELNVENRKNVLQQADTSLSVIFTPGF